MTVEAIPSRVCRHIAAVQRDEMPYGPGLLISLVPGTDQGKSLGEYQTWRGEGVKLKR